MACACSCETAAGNDEEQSAFKGDGMVWACRCTCLRLLNANCHPMCKTRTQATLATQWACSDCAWPGRPHDNTQRKYDDIFPATGHTMPPHHEHALCDNLCKPDECKSLGVLPHGACHLRESTTEDFADACTCPPATCLCSMCSRSTTQAFAHHEPTRHNTINGCKKGDRAVAALRTTTSHNNLKLMRPDLENFMGIDALATYLCMALQEPTKSPSRPIVLSSVCLCGAKVQTTFPNAIACATALGAMSPTVTQVRQVDLATHNSAEEAIIGCGHYVLKKEASPGPTAAPMFQASCCENKWPSDTRDPTPTIPAIVLQ